MAQAAAVDCPGAVRPFPHEGARRNVGPVLAQHGEYDSHVRSLSDRHPVDSEGAVRSLVDNDVSGRDAVDRIHRSVVCRGWHYSGGRISVASTAADRA